MNRFTTADVLWRVSRLYRMSSMAKRTPRSEADDTTTPAPTNREPRGGSRAGTDEGRQPQAGGRPRTARDEGERPTAEEPPPQPSDTAAARPRTNEPTGGEETANTDRGASDLEPTEEEIRVRAYLLFIERGGEHGMDFEDWVRAERELKENKNR
jgi:hypothetical protein